MDESVWRAVLASRAWLDAANGTETHQLTCRILKISEEAGEAAGAWIGVLGNNPRKGVTHTIDDVADELADVVISALVAMVSLDADGPAVLARCAEKILTRMDTARS